MEEMTPTIAPTDRYKNAEGLPKQLKFMPITNDQISNLNSIYIRINKYNSEKYLFSL
jgi:hypothetical protein